MKYRVVLTPTALKDLHKLPRSIQKRVKQKLEFYLSQAEPMNYAVKLIGSNKAGEYRFRAGDYRVVFDKSGESLKILYIEHRREVYRKR